MEMFFGLIGKAKEKSNPVVKDPIVLYTNCVVCFRQIKGHKGSKINGKSTVNVCGSNCESMCLYRNGR